MEDIVIIVRMLWWILFQDYLLAIDIKADHLPAQMFAALDVSMMKGNTLSIQKPAIGLTKQVQTRPQNNRNLVMNQPQHRPTCNKYFIAARERSEPNIWSIRVSKAKFCHPHSNI